MLAEAGVHWIGFPLRLPVHAEDTSESEAARIICELRNSATCVLITYLDQADEIVEFAEFLGVEHVQLHGAIRTDQLQRLRALRPAWTVIKSLVVPPGGREALDRELDNCAPWIDWFITDTFDPDTGASGATGKTHDWAISRALVQRSPRPVILAGGLTPANLGEAIRTVRPAGVDAHTGVETPDGAKAPELVRRFCRAARDAAGA